MVNKSVVKKNTETDNTFPDASQKVSKQLMHQVRKYPFYIYQSPLKRTYYTTNFMCTYTDSMYMIGVYRPSFKIKLFDYQIKILIVLPLQAWQTGNNILLN